MPGQKPTNQELEQRVERAWELLCVPMPRNRATKRLMEQYGVCKDTAQSYIRRAREQYVPELREEDAEEIRIKAIYWADRQLAQTEQAMRGRPPRAADPTKPGDVGDPGSEPKPGLITSLIGLMRLKLELQGVMAPGAPIIIGGTHAHVQSDGGISDRLKAIETGLKENEKLVAEAREESSEPLQEAEFTVQADSGDSA